MVHVKIRSAAKKNWERIDNKYCFDFAHDSGNHGVYIKADTLKEAQEILAARCADETDLDCSFDEFNLDKITEKDSDGTMVWYESLAPIPAEIKG